MASLPRATRNARPGAKRQRVKDLVGKVIDKVLLLSSKNSTSSEHLTRTQSNFSETSPADPPALQQNLARTSSSEPPQVDLTPEDDAQSQEQSVSIGRYPVGLLTLRNVNPDDFIKAVNEHILGRQPYAEISMYGEGNRPRNKPTGGEEVRSSAKAPAVTRELAEDSFNIVPDTASNSSGDFEIGSKGFNALYDTGADISMISLKTLGRLRKSYTRFECLHEDQQIELGDYQMVASRPLGVTSLLWYLDEFPQVIFNTTFWVVTACGTDVILGRDVRRAAVLAVEEARADRPRRKVMRALVGSVNLLANKPEGRLSRHNSHLEDSSLRQEVIRAATS